MHGSRRGESLNLCYHPAVENIGACRMCVVEVEGVKNLQTSCMTTIKEGLKIKTHTDRVEKSRKMNLSLILSKHPNECMTCDMNGHCELQDLTYRYFPDDEYPFYLSTGRILYHYHTGTMTRRVKEISDIRLEVEIEIKPSDAEKLEVKSGDVVRVTSRRGSISGKLKYPPSCSL